MDYYVIVGQKIKELRKSMNMARSQLAEGICSVSYISRIENGSRCPNSLILRQFANKLGISAELLLRTIESSTSLKAFELIKKARIAMEYNHYDTVKSLVSGIDIDKVESLQDRQIILTLGCFVDSVLSDQPTLSNIKIDELLDMTYHTGATPNNIEFSLLLAKANNFILLNNFDAAERILTFLEKKSGEIVFYVSIQPLIRFFITKAIISYHQKNYSEAHKYITSAILKTKSNCYHGCLIECYYVRSKIYQAQGDTNKSTHWYNHSIVLIDLLLNSKNEPYVLAVDRYFNLSDKLID